MAEVNTDVLVAGLKDYAADPEILELLEEFKQSGLIGKLTVAGKLAKHFVVRVEQIVQEIGELGQHGNAKREAVIKVLDDMVKLPMILEPFDDNFFGIVIDMTVGWYNKKLGNSWLDKLKAIL